MKRLTQVFVSVIALTMCALAAMAAQGALRVYYANDPVGRNVVSIESRAPLETMLTTTNAVTGEIRGNPANGLDAPYARFEVDMAKLDTGIDMRNEHMRGAAWLDTAKYPKAVFTLTKVTLPANSSTAPTLEKSLGKTTTVNAEGTLEMHGVTKPVNVKLELRPIAANADTATRLPGDLLHVRATFPIKLNDFGINVAGPAQLKIANEQQVTADIFTSTELPKPPA
ncbi:MAG TPA: YceI family protein [Abditibacteriaceae bacterium]|jgi:polyisoprenoid-binding protein YceI